MKKQILSLILFAAIIIVGTSNSFGQSYQTVLSAQPADCIDATDFVDGQCDVDELHPAQGESYTYTVDNTPANATIRWFVVNNLDVNTNGDSLISVVDGILPVAYDDIDATDGNGTTGGAYDNSASTYVMSVTDGSTNYNSEASTNTSLTMQWKYFDGVSNQVLLVAFIEDEVACTNNIAVYRIIPTPAFTIDVASITDSGTTPAGPDDTPNEECVSPIEFSYYNPDAGSVSAGVTPGDSLIVDYGENWVFFIVNGANYFDSWMPQIQLTYPTGTAPVAEVSWAYMADATSKDDGTTTYWHTLTGSGVLSSTPTIWTGSDPVIAGASATTEGTPGFSVGDGNVPVAGGECIVVRVRLDWGTDIEHDLSNTTLNFAANGIAYDGDDESGTGSFFDDDVNFEDLHYADCQTDGFANDEVDYIITPRPQIEEGTPEFEDKTGDGVN